MIRKVDTEFEGLKSGYTIWGRSKTGISGPEINRHSDEGKLIV